MMVKDKSNKIKLDKIRLRNDNVFYGANTFEVVLHEFYLTFDLELVKWLIEPS